MFQQVYLRYFVIVEVAVFFPHRYCLLKLALSKACEGTLDLGLTQIVNYIFMSVNYRPNMMI